ncbi:hypothetical protein [Novosphingobium kaempferiae]|uniref:hypothetical protein n=1 Tax=Novosphingobium kaempferiae TaxID=2896849 RepID=UPI001E3E2A0D|nr:hypothetical protein [Novosphingobium kaempferiae]
MAIATVGYALDRQARREPDLAKLVPAPFRNFAEEALVRRAVDSGDTVGTLAAAKLLVSRQPMPGDNLEMLGLAALNDRKDALARQAIALAAARGWRSPVPQLVVAASAFDIRSWDVAGDRLAALWKTLSLDERTFTLTQGMLAEPSVRARFAYRVAGYQPAVQQFVEWAGTGLLPDVLADMMTRLSKQGAQFDCNDLGRQAGNLATAGKAQAAQALWDGVCGQGMAGAPASLAFTAARDAAMGPFDWRYPEEPGIEADVSREGKGVYRLTYTNSDPLMKPLATKVSRLGPGAHEVIWTTFDGAASGPLYLRVQCVDTNGQGGYTVNGALRNPVRFDLPAKGCPVQRVTLQAGQGTGGPGALMVK